MSLQPAAPALDSHDDVTLATFPERVIKASETALVIVDFWAPWCGPCQQLGPALKAAVQQTNGAARLAKIDIDKNPQIAQQMRIQSIPAVFAFFKGQPIDGFMGVQPESQIKLWLDGLIQATGVKSSGGADAKEDMTKALAQAEELFNAGDSATALAIYTDIHAEQPDLPAAFAGLLRCMLATGAVDEAAALFAAAPPAMAEDKAMEPVKAALEVALHAQKAKATSLHDLQAKLAANPDDHEARYDLALQTYAAGDFDAAIDGLLAIVEKDRKWHDDTARKQLVQIFEALGTSHPHTIEGRKKLSRILFA